MHLTVVSSGAATDVEVDEGVPVARLRRGLARLTGDAAWTTGTTTADGVPLHDDHPAGRPPLVHGATVRPGPGAVPDAVRAARAPLHLAVVAGPDTGALLVPDVPATLGPGGDLPVADDEGWSLLVRRAGTAATADDGRTRRRWGGDRTRRWPGGGRTRRRRGEGRTRSVRGRRRSWHPADAPAEADSGPVLIRSGGRPPRLARRTTAPRLVGPAGRSRRVPRLRWAVWRPGEELWAGTSVLVLRGAARPGAAGRPGRPALRARLTRTLPAVVGATTSIALAASLHQPVLLLGALSALVLMAPVGAPAGSPTRADAGADDGPRDLAGLRIELATRGKAPADHPRAPWARAPARGAGSRLPVVWEADLTVAGPRRAALAAARAVLLVALVGDDPPTVRLRTDRPDDWAWLAWGRTGAGAGTVTVLDGVSSADAPAPGERVLRLASGTAPARAGRVLEVGAGAARLRDGDGRWHTVPFLGVTAAVAEAVLRAAGVRPALADGSPAEWRCPDDVVLGDLPGIPSPDPAAITDLWDLATDAGRDPRRAAEPGAPPSSGRTPPGGRTQPGGHATLAAPIGQGPGGAAVGVDLVADGPHALVAGTTGSGKSELLTSLVLGLALRHPPDRLAVLLVDFKGGTGLPALAGLPHVVGHLSDLDAAGARRTLRGLSAELRRRERVLGARGARDLRDLDPADPGAPPRLLVVVDEFRVLADELPDLLPGLARIAAQGRSLGVHLVLATQRPAGAVPADLRANVPLRIVLRVADPADCADLVGVPDAASFTRPGLALLARGGRRPEPFQVARAAVRPARPVRLADPWPEDDRPGATPWTPARAAVSALVRGPGALGARPRDDGPAAWVAAIRMAATGRTHAAEPWLPPLPQAVTVADVPPGPGLPLALADLPDELSRGPVRWDPDAGHLLVLGGPGSGRSTALLAVAAAAAAQGRPVHVVGAPGGPTAPAGAGRLDADDVTRVARLVRLLGDAPRPDGPRPVLLLDDVGAVLAGLASLARGAAADRLEQLWATARGPVAVVATGGVGPAAARLAPFFADRLVLGSPDPAGDLVAGVPAELAGPRGLPGRAVHIGPRGAALCQVALPAATPGAAPGGADLPTPCPDSRVWAAPRCADSLASAGPRGADSPAPADPQGANSPAAAGPHGAGPWVVPLPARVPAHCLPAPVRAAGTGGPLVAIGLGGDRAEPVWVEVARPLLVVGPPGSGRSAALAALAAGAAAAGLRVVRAGAGGLPAAPDGDAALLVADDLDEFEARDPVAADSLAARLGTGVAPRLVAATTTAHAVSAFRGPVPALVRARRLLVLDLLEPGALDLLGPEGAWLLDGRRRPPGRGALRLGREVVPVQVVAPG